MTTDKENIRQARNIDRPTTKATKSVLREEREISEFNVHALRYQKLADLIV